MVEQGYDMEPSLLYQDNMSASLLEINGRVSSSKRTKRVKVKCHLIKFRAFRGHVMGIPDEYNDPSFANRCNFRPLNWVPEPVSVLPIQECDRE